jgi:hypothetical protein
MNNHMPWTSSPFKPEYLIATAYADKHGNSYKHRIVDKALFYDTVKNAFLAGVEYQKEIVKSRLDVLK